MSNQNNAVLADGICNNITNFNSKPENFQEEDIIRGELENLDPKTKSNYDALIKYIGEENLRKIFSIQVIFKEEGLDVLLKSLKEIVEKTLKEKAVNISVTENETSKILNLIMKLVFISMKDKHPHISIKTIDIFQNLLSIINDIILNKKVVNLVYDLSVTDKILIKIKEKLGDPNLKIRTKSVDLYCLLLRQNLCDYNNLLTELLEDELKHVDTKKILKSSKTIIGKLSIFDNVFDEIENALQDKRTDEKTFPFSLILKYVIENLTNSKSEIRKLARRILVKMYTAFGYKKIEPMLKKVDERELEKLVELVPEVLDTLKNKQINIKLLQQNVNINSVINNSQQLPINNKSLLARKSLEKRKSIETKNSAGNANYNSNNNIYNINSNNINNNNIIVTKNIKSIEKKKVLGRYQIKIESENFEPSLIKLSSAKSGKEKAVISIKATNPMENIIEGETGIQASTELVSSDLSYKVKLDAYNNEYQKNINNLNTSNSKIQSPSRKNLRIPNNKNKILICSYCGKSDDSFVNSKELESHKNSDCPLFTNCLKCNLNLEVRLLNHHLLSDCNKKSENKLCKRCKEPVDTNSYEEHLKSNNCIPAKNLNSSNRCPLCHKDIPPYDKGFVQHLVNDKCSKQTRNNQ